MKETVQFYRDVIPSEVEESAFWVTYAEKQISRLRYAPLEMTIPVRLNSYL